MNGEHEERDWELLILKAGHSSGADLVILLIGVGSEGRSGQSDNTYPMEVILFDRSRSTW